MAFVGDIKMDEVMADDGLLPFTDSDSQTYSSEEEEEEEEGDGLVSQEEVGGFVSDTEDMDLVPDKGSIGSVSSEGKDEGEDEEQYGTIRPKIPFKQRCDPLVRPNHEKFQKIENYFFSLLRAPGISVDDILQGTFDDHEITLITPQSSPPDLVEWQRRNARRYYENLETRLKGGTDTLAFKMTCLYFGFPVEPLRMGTMPFLPSPDPDPVDAKNAALNADPLAFLNKYNDQEKFIYNKNSISLRGGGVSAWATLHPGEEYDHANPPLLGWVSPKTEARMVAEEAKESEMLVKAIKKAQAKARRTTKKAKQDMPAKGDAMDVDQPAIEQELPMDADWLNPPSPKMNKVKLPPPSKPALPARHFRIYGWQGSLTTSLDYNDFVRNVDKLFSNWDPVDRSLCVEIWRKSPLELVKTALGRLRHGLPDAYVSDDVWRLVKRYFGQGDDDDRYACFVRIGDEPEPTDPKRPGGYQPPSTEGIVRIEHTAENEVVYMRVPKKLRKGHQPHQFSMEYMLAMQALFSADGPHAWVSYQNGRIGGAYQYLDPPGELWEEVINEQNEWSPIPTISLNLESIRHAVVPVIVPGVFATSELPELERKDFRLTKTTQDGTGLSKVYEAVKLSLKNVDLKKECSRFEIWCPGAHFKFIEQQPARIPFSGNIINPASLQEWQKLLGSGAVPDEGFALVVRPVYKVYRIRGIDDDNNTVDVHINRYDLAQFKRFVRNRIYGNYNPKDPLQVLTLSSTNQPTLLIQHNTTEEQWQWILRNIVEPDLDLSLEDADDEWLIPENARWGPRYASMNKPATGNPPPADECATCGNGGSGNSGNGNGRSGKTGSSPYKNDKPLNDVFKDSKNTIDEATRMQLLRDRTFTSVNSIFTNPLKPVMPLHGPPLESILRTGPSMPGVSIAMMTPTEVLRLQREVHSLRFQLLDRTRECPYADCDRYFTFADTVGLDKHIREDHNVLRCFLCDKDKHLLPYYNTDQIKEHFVKEHVNDILKAYGRAGKAGAGKAGAGGSSGPERLCDLFYACGVVTTHMTKKQLREHMKTHSNTPEVSEVGEQSDSMPGSVKQESESDVELDLNALLHHPPNLPSPVFVKQEIPEGGAISSHPQFIAAATPSSSSDWGSDLSPVDSEHDPSEAIKLPVPPPLSENIWVKKVAREEQEKLARTKATAPTAKPTIPATSSSAPATSIAKPPRPDTPAPGPTSAPQQSTNPFHGFTLDLPKKETTTTNPKTEPDVNTSTAAQPKFNTDMDVRQWINNMIEQHAANPASMAKPTIPATPFHGPPKKETTTTNNTATPAKPTNTKTESDVTRAIMDIIEQYTTNPASIPKSTIPATPFHGPPKETTTKNTATLAKPTNPKTEPDVNTSTAVQPKFNTDMDVRQWINDMIGQHAANPATSSSAPATSTAKPPKPTNPKKVPVVDPKTEPNFDIFTAVQPKFTTDADSRQWIKEALERYAANGGKLVLTPSSSKEPALEALRKVNTNPGTFEENMAFIKAQLDEYVAKGGKPSLDSLPKNGGPPPPPPAGAAQLAQVTTDADTTEEEGDAGGVNKMRKRKRRGDFSGSEPYEYSERSAVSDSPANLAPDAAPSPKKQRKGRAVKASRAVVEVAEVSSSDSSSSSSSSSLSSLSSLPSFPPLLSSSDSSSENEESSEFEYNPEDIEGGQREQS